MGGLGQAVIETPSKGMERLEETTGLKNKGYKSHDRRVRGST